MEGTAVIVVIVGGIAVAAAGFVIGRRSLSMNMRSLHEEVKRSSDALVRRERSSEDERHVQDLILGTMQEGVLLFDGGWRTAFANEALERHLAGRPTAVAQLYPPALREMVKEVSEHRRASTIELERTEPTRWLRATAAPAGSDGSILLVVTDITETRRIEAVRRDFVANASHELKTPAASIQAVAETLASVAEHDPAAVSRFAAQLEREALRLSRIVADLLDLSRLESGSDLGNPIRFDQVVHDELDRFEEAAREAGLTVVATDAGPAVVSGSMRDLSLLVRNLIDNAIRYTRPGGTITVSLESGDGTVQLVVGDDGMGIPSRDLPRVFERFYRVDRARSRETGGTGLGLAIVKHVAENHGGTVDVVSELNRGTTFTVRLPAARATASP
jgi:signal transduction histidine kinase